jgi:PhnB protein
VGTDNIKTQIQPMLSIRNGKAALEFYKSAFGAKEVFLLEDSGSVLATLSIDGAEFWLADESPEHHNFSPESLNGSTTRMVLIVSDPDAVFARAISAGAKEIVPVANNYGWRLGRVVDPFGHHWEIGHPLEYESKRRVSVVLERNVHCISRSCRAENSQL